MTTKVKNKKPAKKTVDAKATKNAKSGRPLKSKKFLRTKKVATALTKTTKKMVDQILLKVSPSVEAQIQQLGHNLNKSPLNVDHLKMLGFKVLERAKVISAGFRKENAKKSAAKIVRNKKVRP